MRISTAYFAGMGTVVAAIAAGLGGGLTIANMVSPSPSRPEATRLEQRVSSQPVAPPKQSDPQQAQQPQAPIPYVAASQAAAITPAPAQNQPQTQASNPPPQTAKPPPQPAPPEQTAATDDAAKAGEVDLKRQTSRRKADRQTQWTDRRKYDDQREQELRDAQARMQDDDAPRDVVIRRDWRDDRHGWGGDRRGQREDRDEDSDRPIRIPFPGFNLFRTDD
jgi:hypothetical protein